MRKLRNYVETLANTGGQKSSKLHSCTNSCDLFCPFLVNEAGENVDA